MTPLVCYNGGMATNDSNQAEAIGRLRKTAKLIAAIDTLVDQALPSGSLEDRWNIALSMGEKLSTLAWQELATRAATNVPSEDTIAMVVEGLKQRIVILKRAAAFNHGNNVSPIR